jgi:hypothetical protein
MKMAMG